MNQQINLRILTAETEGSELQEGRTSLPSSGVASTPCSSSVRAWHGLSSPIFLLCLTLLCFGNPRSSPCRARERSLFCLRSADLRQSRTPATCHECAAWNCSFWLSVPGASMPRSRLFYATALTNLSHTTGGQCRHVQTSEFIASCIPSVCSKPCIATQHGLLE